MISQFPQTPGMNIGGRFFPGVSGLLHLMAVGNASTGPNATAKASNTSAGYQVPVGRTLRITAIRVQGAAAPEVALATSTADAGYFNAGALTGPVYIFSSAAAGVSFGGGAANTAYEFAVNFTVAAGLYLSMTIIAGANCKCEFFGYLE